MGFTPFLLSAGVSPASGGGGSRSRRIPQILDLMIQHGANVNAQVTGTKTYSMRISYNPQNSPTKEGYSALHAAAQARQDGSGALPTRQGSKSAARRGQWQEGHRSASRGWRQPSRSGACCGHRQHCRACRGTSRGSSASRPCRWAWRGRPRRRGTRQPGNCGRDSRPSPERAPGEVARLQL